MDKQRFIGWAVNLHYSKIKGRLLSNSYPYATMTKSFAGRVARLTITLETGLTLLLVATLMLGTPGCRETREGGPTEYQVSPQVDKMNDSQSTQVIVWQRGSKKELDSDQPFATELQQHCEQLLATADGFLELIVTKHKVEEIRNALALEIIYPTVREFRIQIGKGQLALQSLLIPLSSKNVVIYTRATKGYSAGPLVNSRATTDKLRRLLEEKAVLIK